LSDSTEEEEGVNMNYFCMISIILILDAIPDLIRLLIYTKLRT